MEQAKTQKQQYQTPRLKRYGTLRELTQAGRSKPGEDFIIYKDGNHGSVVPPVG